MKAALPDDELDRLEALRQYDVLDTAENAAFDDITRLAAQILQMPISLVSLVDETRQWFKSHFGLNLRQTSRELSFCAHAILKPDEVFEVPDARVDPIFFDNALVTGEPHIRFYAGVALVTPTGRALGTLNVIDHVPRRLSEEQKLILKALGRQTVAQLELHRHANELRAEAVNRTQSETRLRAQYEQLIEQLRVSDREKSALLEAAERSRSALAQALENERRTRVALQEAQHFTSRVTEIMPSVLYVYDIEERKIVYLNHEVVSSLGYSELDLISDPRNPVTRFMHPDDHMIFMRHLQAVLELKDGQVAEFMYRMRHAHGDWRWFQSRDAVMTRNAGLSAKRIVGTATDITAVKGTQAALLESEQRYRTLWETAPDSVIVLDQACHIQYANASTKRIFGWAPEMLIGQDIATLQAEGFRAAHRAGMARYLATGTQTIDWRATEVVGLHRDGHEFAMEVSFSHVEVNGKQMFAGFLRNIEERKRAEADRARLADFLEKSLNEVYVFSPSTLKFDYVNQAGRANLGRSLDHLKTMTPLDIAGAFTVDSYRALLQPLLTGDERLVTFKTSHLRADGTRYAALVTAQLVGSGADRVVLETALDVTVYEEAEAARSDLLLQLRQSQKMEALGTLAGGIAHDFNNIVGAMLGNVVLARQDLALEHPARQSIDQINKAALRARDLVSQILAFSRRQEPSRIEQPLGPIVKETTQLLRATLPAKVTFKLTIPSDPVVVHADATQMEQVLMNLCTNAWHASTGSAPSIEIGLDRSFIARDRNRSTDGLPPGEYAHLWVADNGCGMDAATRARMFEPFFTTKPVGQGTGLGLSVVHGIVVAHHGAITVESEVGSGTRVHVYLPLLQHAEAAEIAPTPLAPSDVLGTGQHVLCVDDDELMLLMVERLLQRAGFRVTAAQDAEAAIGAVRKAPYEIDLVLSDFNMPGRSGLEMAKQILLIRPDLPIVLISGDISNELRAEAAQFGIAALLQKQDAFDQLAGLVQALCNKPLLDRQTEPMYQRRAYAQGLLAHSTSEAQRLQTLRELVILDTDPEPMFDAIAKLASELCGVPIALLSLVDHERQWFKANVGLTGIQETPRDVAFCAHAIADDSLFEVPDATQDARFADNPLVKGTPGIRFYAGAPLVLPSGERVGTLCVIDRETRGLTEEQAQRLLALARITSEALVMRRDLIHKALVIRSREGSALETLAARMGTASKL